MSFLNGFLTTDFRFFKTSWNEQVSFVGIKRSKNVCLVGRGQSVLRLLFQGSLKLKAGKEDPKEKSYPRLCSPKIQAPKFLNCESGF